MQIDIYRGDTFAASYEYGRGAIFVGPLGVRVHGLVAAPHWVTNPWTGERAYAPADERPDWWAAAILSAPLAAAGFRAVAEGLPAAPSRRLVAAAA